MSNSQNLIYALVQVAHNFGAVAVVSASISGIILDNWITRRTLAWLVLAGWALQALSGGAFGATTYSYEGKLPDIAGIARTALITKIACAVGGSFLLSAYLYWGAAWAEKKRIRAWSTSSAFAITALTAAAFLRWYS